MINDLDMQGWAYLLAPTFQFVNTAGKPLTEGYLEVYIAGTRNKYYCASDFDGTLHPFQIPLDSLGSNIVLADPSQAYDVYAYNRFGSLIMSRYNVSSGNTGGSGALTITISSDDDTVQVVKDGNNYDLSIADTIARIDDIEERLSEIGDGSVGYAIANAELASGGLFNLTDDKNKDIDYTSDMHGFRLKPGHVYQLNFNAKFDCNNDTNDLISGKFYLEGDNAVAQEWQFNVDNSFEHQESFNGSTVLVIPDDVSYYDVKLKYLFDDEELDLYLNKISIVDVTSLVSQIASGINEYTEGDGINIVDNSISVDMDYINEHLDIDASSILSSAYHYTDARVSQVSGDLINIIAEATGNIPIPEQVQSDWNESDSSQPSYINNKPDLSIYATNTELGEVSGNIVSMIPDPQVQSDWSQDDDTQVDYIKNKPEEETVEFEEINLSDYALASAIPSIEGLATISLVSSVSSVLKDEIDNIPEQVNADWESDSGKSEILNKPDLSIYATINQLSEVSGDIISQIPDAQVQSDWTEADTSLPSYIQHKPEEEEVTFEEINLSDYALASAIPSIDGLATVAQVSSVSSILKNEIDNIPEQVQSDWNQDDDTQVDYIKNKPDLSIYATQTSVINLVSSVSSVLQNEIDNIPSQVQSDWTEDDDTLPSYIQHKPEEESVEFFEVNLNDYALVSAIPDISNLATKDELNTASGNIINYVDNRIGNVTNVIESVSGGLQEQINNIPAQVQSDWDEDDSSQPSYINNKPDLSIYATHDEVVNAVSGASGNIINYVNEQIGEIPAQVQSDWAEDDSEDLAYIKNKPDLSVYATINDVNAVTALIPEAQVQSNWTEVDTNDPSYILNKPNELELVAGNNINIVVSGTNIVINSTASAVTGLDLLYGKFTSNNVSTTATMAKSKGNINVSEGKIQLEQGKSYHVTVRGYYQQTNAANSYTPISFIEYITSNPINIDIDRSRTDTQYFELSYDLYNLNSDTDYQIAFSGCAGLVKDLIVEVHSLGGAGTGSSSGVSAIEYDAGYGINIANKVISVDNTVALKTDIPDTTNLATKTEVQAVSAAIPQSSNLIPGDNITITASGNDYVIDSIGGGGTTYTAGDYIDITNDVISVDTSDVVDIVPGSNVTITVSGSSAIISSTGEPQVQSDWNVTDSSSKAYIKNKPNIPAAQIQSNWNETNTSSKAYIQNKPTIHTYTGASGVNITNDVVSLDNPIGLVAGTNVTIEVSGSSAVLNANSPSLSSLNTAGISDIQVVNALPASPVTTVLYLIPEV